MKNLSKLFFSIILATVITSCTSNSGGSGGGGSPGPSNPKIINEKPGTGTVVAYGDSLTSGFQNHTPYTTFLDKKLNQNIVNTGVAGIHTGDAVKGINEVLKLNPKVVIITIGGNDFFRVPALQSFENLAVIIDRIQKKGALAVFLGVLPDIYQLYPEVAQIPPAELARYNVDLELLPKLNQIAKDSGALVVDDILKDMWTRADLMQDKVHPNSIGNEIVAQRVFEALKGYYP